MKEIVAIRINKFLRKALGALSPQATIRRWVYLYLELTRPPAMEIWTRLSPEEQARLVQVAQTLGVQDWEGGDPVTYIQFIAQAANVDLGNIDRNTAFGLIDLLGGAYQENQQ